MTTEQKLKEQCTPEIIKKMVELAEGEVLPILRQGDKNKMKYLSIKREDGSISTVRYECESATEKSLTYEEEIIKELYHKIAELEQLLKDAEERASMFEMAGVLQFKEKEKLEQQVEELKKENVRLSNLIRYSRV